MRSAVPLGWVSSAEHETFRNPMSRLLIDATVAAPIEGLTIKANTTRLRRSGEVVEVRFCCVQDPKEDDFVALYAPWDAEPNATAPVKMRPATEAPEYMNSGVGTLR